MKVDLGCGRLKRPGFIGVDSEPLEGVDKVADLSSKFPFEDNSVEYVYSSHVLEHMTDPLHFLSEVHRILEVGGVAELKLPLAGCQASFQFDHKTFWMARDFYYMEPGNFLHYYSKGLEFRVIKVEYNHGFPVWLPFFWLPYTLLCYVLNLSQSWRLRETYECFFIPWLPMKEFTVFLRKGSKKGG